MPPPHLEAFEDFVEIGRGGFGVVYRAHQPALNRYVAIKVLAASLSSSGRERLSREALAMGALSGHPNIVAVVDVGIPVEGEPYIVMPYLARGSLADAIAASGPMPWPDVARIGVKLAGALESAHRLGILHRDVKPGNILVSDFGEPQLADFGLARVAGGFETTSRHITASVSHAAPEILEGRQPSAASDVYSLASTLYALVAGRPAFIADDDESLVALYVRIASSPVPDLAGLGVPEPFFQVLDSAMAKRPAERPVSAAEFGRMLQQVEAGEGRPVTDLPIREVSPTLGPAQRPPAPVVSGPTRVTAPAPRNRRWLWVGAPVVLVAVAVVGVVLATNDPSPEGAGTETADAIDDGELSTTSPGESPASSVSCLRLPGDVPWYQRVDELAPHQLSDEYIASIADAPTLSRSVLHAGFGSDTGLTYNVVTDVVTDPLSLGFDDPDDEAASDPGPYPIPPEAVGAENSLIVVDDTTCTSYEVYGDDETQPWTAAVAAAAFPLNTAFDRPDGAPSAVQSGLPLFPMLVRYDEVAQDAVDHALLFNAPLSPARFVHPATKGIGGADASDDPSLPPLGSRFRLDADFDCTTLSTDEVRTICDALRTYGMILSGSSGSLFILAGASDPRWDDEAIRNDFNMLTPDRFEVVDTGETIR